MVGTYPPLDGTRSFLVLIEQFFNKIKLIFMSYDASRANYS